MKKLSLKNLNLGANDLLQRSQLKTIFGGYGGGSDGGASCLCNDGTSYTVLNCDWCNINCNNSTGQQQGWICSGPSA